MIIFSWLKKLTLIWTRSFLVETDQKRSDGAPASLFFRCSKHKLQTSMHRPLIHFPVIDHRAVRRQGLMRKDCQIASITDRPGEGEVVKGSVGPRVSDLRIHKHVHPFLLECLEIALILKKGVATLHVLHHLAGEIPFETPEKPSLTQHGRNSKCVLRRTCPTHEEFDSSLVA